MTDANNETWEQRTFREIREAAASARADGEASGEVRARRETLRVLLEDRFRSLPQELDEQVEGVKDIERLRAALYQALHVPNLPEFEI